MINWVAVGLPLRIAAALLEEVLIARNEGSLGVRITPLGGIKGDQAPITFSRQIAAQVGTGANPIVIETISDLSEIVKAVGARGGQEDRARPTGFS